MKILIVCLHRTGSTFLMEKIAKERDIKFISEPFDGRNPPLENFPKNCVVKSIIKQHPHNIRM